MSNSTGDGGGSSANDDSQSSETKGFSRWRVTERIFAIIGAVASLVAVISVIITGVEHTPLFQEHREEAMVSNLVPGDDYAKMIELIGSAPDFHESLHSGRQLYVFDRRWEYIQLLVDSSDTVLSVGIYAKNTSFKATLVTGTILNGSPIGQQIYAPIGAIGDCGASWYFYYQGYTLPEAGTARSEIVASLPVTDTNNQVAIAAACRVLMSEPCAITYFRKNTKSTSSQSLSAQLLKCIESSKAGQAMIANLLPSAVIVTAPYQPIVPDMLNEDYFFKLAHV